MVSTLLAQVVLTLRSVDFGVGRPRVDHGLMRQNLRRHKEESYDNVMLRCDSSITVYSWHIHDSV
jgi:hypothetical protein